MGNLGCKFECEKTVQDFGWDDDEDMEDNLEEFGAKFTLRNFKSATEGSVEGFKVDDDTFMNNNLLSCVAFACKSKCEKSVKGFEWDDDERTWKRISLSSLLSRASPNARSQSRALSGMAIRT